MPKASARAVYGEGTKAGRERKGLALGLIGVFVFGLTLPATRIAVAELDPLFVTVGRALVAAGFAALTLLIGGSSRPRGRDWSRLGVFAAGSIFGFPLLMSFAMRYAPASHGGVVLAVMPLLTAMAGVVVAGERPSAGFWMCGLAGTAAVLLYALLSAAGASELHWADLMLAGAALCASIGYASAGELSRRLGGWEVISWALLLSVPGMLLLLLATGPVNWSASAAAWAGFLYVAAFSQFLGFFAWNKGLALGGIAKVGQTQLLQTFVTLAGSALLLGEAVGWMEIGFALLVVGLVALGWRMRVARTH